MRDEVRDLGFPVTHVASGRIDFLATPTDIARANLWLRCADRVLLHVGEFQALTFDELFEQTKALPWEAWIPQNGRFPVVGKSVKSTLRSVRSCQSIVKKAVADRLQSAHHTSELPETGAEYMIQVALLRDRATLTLDTSGAGLHKRGYRAAAGAAPLKETFAAGLVRLSGWQPEQILIDPMCGSGTIPIEAALLARNAAPGLHRTFAAEAWPAVPAGVWAEARAAAEAAIKPGNDLQIFGYDVDKKGIETAVANAGKAGVAGQVTFAPQALQELWIDRQYGTLIANPPYGMRMAEFRELNAVYRTLNQIFRKKRGWSLNILTADEKFPGYMKRGRPDKMRKFYNGCIKVHYYQYFAKQPQAAS